MKVKIILAKPIYESFNKLHDFKQEDIGELFEFSESFCNDLIKNGFAVPFSEEKIETPKMVLETKVVTPEVKKTKLTKKKK